MGVQLPSEPITRKESYLAKAAGQAVEIPAEPITREEAYLDAIAKGSGGGGGGTSDYNQLTNQPQINGTTLIGNKSASDLGLASTADLAGKQDALTAGDYIAIDDGEIGVNRYVNPAGDIVYRAVTVNATTAYVDKYTPGGTFIERINITVNTYQSQDVESKIRFYREYDGWVITLLANSKEHNAGYSYSARTSGSGVESQNDFTFTISQTLDDNDLITRSELATKQNALTFDSVPTDGSMNPVESNGVYDALATKANTTDVTTALATKQNVTDNTLETNNKTVSGAINEVNSNVSDLQEWTDTDTKTVTGNPITISDAAAVNAKALSMTVEPIQDLHGYDKPWVGGAGKNKLPLVLADLKTINSSGTWNGNVYTFRDITYTVVTDDADNVIAIKASGENTSGNNSLFHFCSVTTLNQLLSGTYIMSGCPANGSDSTYRIYIGTGTYDSGAGVEFTTPATGTNCGISIYNGYTIPTGGLTFYPMIRLSTETDATFAPYTNICPITGHTDASVEIGGGKNLLNVNTPDVIVGKTVLSDGSLIEAEHVNVSDYIQVKDGAILTNTSKTYSNWGYNRRIVCYDENKQFLGTCVQTTDNPTGIVTITGTVLANTKYVRVPFTREDTSAEQLEYGTQATPYVPYQSHTATIAFGQTVYGGEVNFETGVMTVDKADISISSGFNKVTSQEFDYSLRTKGKAFGLLTCDRCIRDTSASSVIPFVMFLNQNGDLVVRTYEEYSTAGDFLTAIGGSVQAAYELATPTTIQLTPQQIQLLKGHNTITANGATISLTYQPDNLVGEVMEQVDDKIAVSEDAIGAQLDGKANTSVVQTSDTAIEVNGSYNFEVDENAKAIVIAVSRYGIADSITVPIVVVTSWNNNNELYFVMGAGQNHVILKMNYNDSTKVCNASVKESTVVSTVDIAVYISAITLY